MQNLAMKLKQKRTAPKRPLVVATAHTPRGLREAAGLAPGVVDWVEVRLDLLAGRRQVLREVVPALRLPVLLTARHPAEGGAKSLTAARREDLLREFLPLATAVDVELRSARALHDVLALARQHGVLRVISFHDFQGTPTLAKLRRAVASARQAGADIVKVATLLRTPHDLAVLLELQAAASRVPLATMGMGPLGRVSRLVLAAAGSRLNYGYLDRAQVPGQWPAVELKHRLEEVLP
jgi:3-dehydroquinate dehydratase-1